MTTHENTAKHTAPHTTPNPFDPEQVLNQLGLGSYANQWRELGENQVKAMQQVNAQILGYSRDAVDTYATQLQNAVGMVKQQLDYTANLVTSWNKVAFDAMHHSVENMSKKS